MKKHAADDPIRAALARDDPAAVELLWDRYADDLLAFLQARLGSRHDAEDVLQAVFVRIVRKRRQLAGARQLNAYVYQIARNQAAQFLRSRERKSTVVSADEPWLLVTQSDDIGKELAEQLQAGLAQLSPEQREVVVLKMYREKTFREIARLLHISLNTAASRYRYGLEKLRVLLEDLIS